MKTYHEIFVEPDGRWLVRVYEGDKTTEMEGQGPDYEAGRANAIRAAKAFYGVVEEVVQVMPRRWWRFW